MVSHQCTEDAPMAFKTAIHPLHSPAPFSPLNICDRRPNWPPVCCPPHPASFILTIDLGTIFSLTSWLHVHSGPLSLSPVQTPPPPHKALSPVKVTFLYPHFLKLPFLTGYLPKKPRTSDSCGCLLQTGFRPE